MERIQIQDLTDYHFRTQPGGLQNAYPVLANADGQGGKWLPHQFDGTGAGDDAAEAADQRRQGFVILL